MTATAQLQSAPTAEMNLDPARLSDRKNMVRIFYKEMWDKANISLVPELFHDDFTFRGSLGPVLVGHREFSQYVVWLTATLENYTSDIFEMIEEGDKIACKLRFHGYHKKSFFGVEPSGGHVWWHGAPIFTFDGGKISDLWVLGDIHGLVERMAEAEDRIEFRAEGR